MEILWPDGGWTFVFLTVILGGGAAYLSGRAVARTWRPITQLVFYCLLLSLFVRFLHFALFQAQLLSLGPWLADLVVILAGGLLGFRLTRVRQMVTQYRWLYRRAGPFSWRERRQSVDG
ncbi:MAG: hypothetical protein R3E87_16835 [Burkholderiaceae bacterium]